jgi:restriction system protein
MLNYGADKQEHSYRDTVEFLAHEFNLNDKEKRELILSGRMPFF